MIGARNGLSNCDKKLGGFLTKGRESLQINGSILADPKRVLFMVVFEVEVFLFAVHKVLLTVHWPFKVDAVYELHGGVID